MLRKTHQRSLSHGSENSVEIRIVWCGEIGDVCEEDYIYKGLRAIYNFRYISKKTIMAESRSLMDV